MMNVVSFSGGRTSAYLLWLMEQKRQAGEDVHYVFMDTGSCSESCEIFGGQLDFDFGQDAA